MHGIDARICSQYCRAGVSAGFCRRQRAGIGLVGRSAGRNGQGLPKAREAAARRDRQEDRGDRVLLVLVPALQGHGADLDRVDQASAGGRAAASDSRAVFADLGGHGEGLVHARRARRRAAGSRRLQCHSRPERASRSGQGVLRLGRDAGTRSQESRGHVQLVRGQRQGGACENAGAVVQRPVGTDLRRRWQILDRNRPGEAS